MIIRKCIGVMTKRDALAIVGCTPLQIQPGLTLRVMLLAQRQLLPVSNIQTLMRPFPLRQPT